MTSTWLEFWNAPHSVYVSRRHVEYHTNVVARDVLSLPEAKAGCVLLDYGCGEALAAPFLAEHGLTVLLYDPALTVQESNRARYKNNDRIRVLSDADLSSIAGAADIILVNSVLQYLSPEETSRVVIQLRTMLAPSGVLYLADVVMPQTPVTDDVVSLLVSGWRGHFLGAALVGLVRTFFSDYRTLRRSLGFTTWSPDAIMHALALAGFKATRVYPNIGPSPHRMMIRATKLT